MNEKTKQVSNSEEQTILARRRLLAAQAIQKHFSQQPMSVIILSMTAEGRVQCDVTEHPSLGTLLFNQKLIDKYVNESFEKSLIQSQACKGEHTETEKSALQSGAV